MKRLRNIALLTAVIAVTSCGNSARLDYKQKVTPIRGEFLPVDGLIGAPYGLTCINTLLIYYDYYDGKMISVYDLEKKQLTGRHVSVGNGPGEATRPLAILPFPQKDTLYAFQRNTATLNLFSVPEIKMLSSSISFSFQPYRMTKIKDYYIGTSDYDKGRFGKGRFGVYNSKGELLYTDETYPFRGENMERIPALVIYQGYLCASPEKNRFAFGCLLCNHISFYEVRENEIVLLKEHISSGDAKASYPNQLVVEDDCVVSYTCAYGTASYCYMLYSGKTYAEDKEQLGGGNYILVFDWQGNYIKTLETDRKIQNFCVDEPNNTVYATALSDDGEYGIMQFKL